MKSVMLDPGKGGINFGIRVETLIEKEINLNIALKCREELIRHGIQVYMTREDDSYVGYTERIVKGNKVRSNIFVSIHCNSGGGALAELIYSVSCEKGFKLADKISAELKVCGQNAVKIYNRLGHNFKDFNVVIRDATMDSTIIKCAFLDNEDNRSLIDNMEKQQGFGIAIAKGILKYFNIDYIKE